MDGFRLITDTTDTTGTRHLVDAGGVRQLTETPAGFWDLAIAGGNWAAIRRFAEQVLATDEPDGS